MKKLLLFTFCVVFTTMTFAQWINLNHPVLSGSSAREMIYTGSTILSAGEGGIFRSTDNGNTWTKANTGLDSNSINISSICNFKNEIWVYASGLYKSNNQGQSWTKVNITGLDQNNWFNEIGTTGSKIFALQSGWDQKNSTNFTLLCYSNDGIDWTAGDTVVKGKNNNTSFVKDNAAAMYIVSENNGLILSTIDGITIDTIPTLGLPIDNNVRADRLVADSLGENLFFSVESNLYKYNFGTQQWSESTTGITSGFVGLTNISIAGDYHFISTYFMVNPTTLGIALYVSTDHGDSWTEVPNPGLTYPMFEDGMVEVGNSRILAIDFSKNLYKSDDHGQTWSKITEINALDYSSLNILQNGELYALRSNIGVLKSTDNGSTWSVYNGDFPNFQGLYFINDMITKSNTLFATGQLNPMESNQYLYKSVNSGQNWINQTAAPDSAYKSFCGFSGQNLIMFFSNKNQKGSYQYTTDLGTTWIDFTTGITPLNLNKVLGFFGNGDTLFMAAYDNMNMKKLYWSFDNGMHFSNITYGLTSIELVINNEWGNNNTEPNIIGGFGANSQNPIVCGRESMMQNSTIKFYRLNQAKDAWETVNSNGLNFSQNLGIRKLKNYNGVWYLVTDLGIYTSIDDCKTWTALWNNEGLTQGMQNNAFAIRNNNLYLGTYGTGIWSTQISAPTLSTNTVTAKTDTSALGGATITSTGGLPFGEKGLCWGTSPNPTTSNNKIIHGSSQSDFNDTIFNLTAHTTYYVRAYVINPFGTTYGNEVSFVTEFASNIENMEKTQVSVFPIPAENQLFISNHFDGNVEIRILNINGQEVSETIETGSLIKLNISTLQAGIYSIQIKNNDHISTRKLQIIK